MFKDRRFLKVSLPMFVLREWGMKAAKILMEDFFVIEAVASLPNDTFEFTAWHPDAAELYPGVVAPLAAWVFSEKREGGELVKVVGTLHFNGKTATKTIHFKNTVEAERPAYDKEEFSV